MFNSIYNLRSMPGEDKKDFNEFIEPQIDHGPVRGKDIEQLGFGFDENEICQIRLVETLPDGSEVERKNDNYFSQLNLDTDLLEEIGEDDTKVATENLKIQINNLTVEISLNEQKLNHLNADLSEKELESLWYKICEFLYVSITVMGFKSRKFIAPTKGQALNKVIRYAISFTSAVMSVTNLTHIEQISEKITEKKEDLEKHKAILKGLKEQIIIKEDTLKALIAGKLIFNLVINPDGTGLSFGARNVLDYQHNRQENTDNQIGRLPSTRLDGRTRM